MSSEAPVLEALRARGPLKKLASGGWMANCPAHEDAKASLKVDIGADGRALLKCHAGCSTDEIVAALGLTTADLFLRRNGNEARREVAVYKYADESGRHLYDVVRFTGKEFRQRRPDGSWGLGGARRVLYRLPDVLAAIRDGSPVYVVEGEKDADAINAIPDGSAVATTNPMGAGKWRPDYSESLRGGNVTIVQDKDEPGRRHAREVAGALKDIAASVRIVEAKQGKDAADHLAAGLTLDQLVPAGPKKRALVKALDLLALLTGPVEPVPWVIEPLLARGEAVVVAGESGIGKSWMTADLALSLAGGTPFLGSLQVSGGPYRVMVVDLENSMPLIRWRMRKLVIGKNLKASEAGSLPIAYHCQPSLSMSDVEDRDALFAAVESFRPDWVIVDSLVRCHRGDENSNSDMRDVFGHLGRLKDYGAGYLVTHHLRKPTKGDPSDDVRYRIRGASDVLAAVDEAWGLQQKDDGFVLIHEKTRWERPSGNLEVCIEDVFGGDGVKLTASSSDSSAQATILDTLTLDGAAGSSRQELIKSLERIGLKSARRQANHVLSKLHRSGEIRKKGNQSAMRYWLASHAPEEAE